MQNDLRKVRNQFTWLFRSRIPLARATASTNARGALGNKRAGRAGGEGAAEKGEWGRKKRTRSQTKTGLSLLF